MSTGTADQLYLVSRITSILRIILTELRRFRLLRTISSSISTTHAQRLGLRCSGNWLQGRKYSFLRTISTWWTLRTKVLHASVPVISLPGESAKGTAAATT